MKCLACFKPITTHNRQIADRDIVVAGITVAKMTGRPLPYCKDCIKTYKIRKELGRLDVYARAKYVKDTHDQLLKGKPYKPADLVAAIASLEKCGFTKDEQSQLVKGLA